MHEAKQQVSDLAFTDKDWTRALPPGFYTQLRIDASTLKDRTLPSGQVWRGTDLRWWLATGRHVPGLGQSALMLVDARSAPPAEVHGVFKGAY